MERSKNTIINYNEELSGDVVILLEQYDERTIALAKLLNLTKEEIDEISEGNTYNNDLSYGGIDYFVGTDGEAEDRAIHGRSRSWQGHPIYCARW